MALEEHKVVCRDSPHARCPHVVNKKLGLSKRAMCVGYYICTQPAFFRL